MAGCCEQGNTSYGLIGRAECESLPACGGITPVLLNFGH